MTDIEDNEIEEIREEIKEPPVKKTKGKKSVGGNNEYSFITPEASTSGTSTNQRSKYPVQSENSSNYANSEQSVEESDTYKRRYREYVMGMFRKTLKRQRMVSDIIETNLVGGGEASLGRLSEQRYGGAIFIVAKHSGSKYGSPYHIVHDCTYYNSYYSCARMSIFHKRRKSARNVVWTSSLTGAWLFHTTEYFATSPRKIIYCEIRGRDWTRGHKMRGIPVPRGLSNRQEPMVEACFKEAHFFNFVTCGSYQNSCGQNSELGNEKFPEAAQHHKISKRDQPLKFLKEHPTAPISAILTHYSPVAT
ncbi:uncharacterized protein LOC123683979 [Harmonia axyridis]|uniref:uncharacterized protein LOC123683979 n=1 Tax=Harmonia axyridis TaxID=115357 RepID=UPI001E2765CA|nr:uncharacterized protein LOC123683979 [Harmonia axyridis]